MDDGNGLNQAKNCTLQATIDEVKDYFVKSFVRQLLDDLLGQLAALQPQETGRSTQARPIAYGI